MVFAPGSRGDATKLYDANLAGWVIDPAQVAVIDIGSALTVAASSVLPFFGALSNADKETVGIALAAWWSRLLTWPEIKAHLSGPLGQLLPAWAKIAGVAATNHLP